eukprot:scaffold2801_cov106-Skeletonema_dohrnii-CCMP3373.AAC.12
MKITLPLSFLLCLPVMAMAEKQEIPSRRLSAKASGKSAKGGSGRRLSAKASGKSAKASGKSANASGKSAKSEYVRRLSAKAKSGKAS